MTPIDNDRVYTIGEIYGPAMKITDQGETAAYFAELVAYMQARNPGMDSETAREAVLSNLGYYAGYYDNATRRRVERVFGAAHPIFGPTTPTAGEAFSAGQSFVRGKEPNHA
jgi:Asp-tRNA(Asn)/Glu-tRNA(Gln) amidotransferase A subunit family amidase